MMSRELTDVEAAMLAELLRDVADTVTTDTVFGNVDGHVQTRTHHGQDGGMAVARESKKVTGELQTRRYDVEFRIVDNQPGKDGSND
jgi:hypothetical protein